jgi:uncharacterized protein (TIGR03435 family)
MLVLMKASPRFFAFLIVVAVAITTNGQVPAPRSEGASPATTASAAPSIEVATIRMADDHDQEMIAQGIQPQSWNTFPTNHVYYHKVPLNMLISIAYGLDIKYILDQPKWMDSQQYDVDAKIEGDQQVTAEQAKPLLQKLLAQRFNLKVHRESRVISGYALVIANDGPKLRSGGKLVRPSGTSAAVHIKLTQNRLDARDVTLIALARVLEVSIGEPVMDKTGLTGSYDIELSFARPNDPDSTYHSIFTALQEQLGLKLESAKVPVDNLVIDHVDRVPTEN